MRRRDFIIILGSAAVAWPLAARAQQPAVPVIGYLGSESPDVFAGRLRAFRQGLSETGYVEGDNVAIEYRWAENQHDRFPALLADLVGRKVTVIAAVTGTPPALAAKAATTTIPIVFATAGDPVALGLVASLNRPGGNLTGVATLTVELGPKQLEMLRELVPTATIIALLVNPTNPTNAETLSRDLQAAARTLGLQLHVLHASTERDFDTVFATLSRLRAGALVIGSDPFFNSRNQQLAGECSARPWRCCVKFTSRSVCSTLLPQLARTAYSVFKILNLASKALAFLRWAVRPSGLMRHTPAMFSMFG